MHNTEKHEYLVSLLITAPMLAYMPLLAEAKAQSKPTLWTLYRNKGQDALCAGDFTSAKINFELASEHYDQDRYLEEPLTIFARALVQYLCDDFAGCDALLHQLLSAEGQKVGCDTVTLPTSRELLGDSLSRQGRLKDARTQYALALSNEASMCKILSAQKLRLSEKMRGNVPSSLMVASPEQYLNDYSLQLQFAKFRQRNIFRTTSTKD